MDAAADETARLSADLRHALPDGQIFALYQPIVDLLTGATIGGEVLMRWRHPDRGLVPPDLFIPVAERNGSIIELGYWVLRHACRQAAAWQTTHGALAPSKISVNVSARQLAEPDFADQVQAILHETGAEASRLVLEVTETAVLATGTAISQLHRLRAPTRQELRLAIVTWIEKTYHRRRRQNALGRLTPIEYETLHHTAHAA
ncbi:EAL domain-containing protein [Cryptosporangium sp. NPDC048952]|uniref:EAL domain-containing protein n=1 Tax=Cryptosporangium sp. NPDC048952 TaxID=3363961 RepID=UPI003714A19B